MSLLFEPGQESLRDSHGEYVLRTGKVLEITRNLVNEFFRVTVDLGKTPGEEWLGHVTAFDHNPPENPVGCMATVRIYKVHEDRIEIDRVLKWERPVCPTVWERLGVDEDCV